MKITFFLILAFFVLSCNTETKKQPKKANLNKELLPDSTYRTGIHKFKVANENIKDSIVEYLNIEGKEYANRIWLVDKNNDTIKGGAYFESFINDTTILGEITRLRFVLTNPTVSYESDMYILLPFDDDELKDDYSNLFEIKCDTFPSLKNDGIPHPEVADLALHHITEFGLEYSKPGKKRVRGVIIERDRKDGKGYERRSYFNNSFYIKE